MSCALVRRRAPRSTFRHRVNTRLSPKLPWLPEGSELPASETLCFK